jgi:arylsulfatase A-like enzyme
MRTVLVAIAVSLGLACAGEGARDPLNVVFVLVDDLGYADIGANNPDSFYETPNIDALAQSAMRFTDAYAAAPVCSPTRASILSGKYPQRVRVTDYIGAAQPDNWSRNTHLLGAPYSGELALEEATLPEILKGAGYSTFFAGKWHLGAEAFWPEHQGFDFNLGGIARGGPYGGDRYFSPYGNPRLADGPPGEHLPARLAQETVAFIEANRDTPFLAYLSFYSVHTPLMARPDLEAKYEEKRARLGLEAEWGEEDFRRVRQVQEHAVYAGMVEAMDEAVGTVLDALERLGLDDRTIVVFTSDNGGLSTSEGHPTSNLPLRGGKGWMFEGGIREPTIVRVPSVTEPGSVSQTVATSPDWIPTLLDAAGVPVPESLVFDGVSIMPALRGEEMARGPVFWHYPHYGNQGGFPSGAVRDGDWKLIENYEDGTHLLFNLRDDVGEQVDLAMREPDRVRQMAALLSTWREEVGALMPTTNPAYDATKPSGR